MKNLRWTSHDLELLPEDKRYEIVEVLSPGSENQRRDREVKLKLYSRRGAEEYWVISWQERRVEVYRREDAVLTLHKTFNENDVLQSPLLQGFSCRVGQLFTSAF